uniref:Innexin n=1 Tax=Ascaris suum TaxID=6253 RepID=F1L806_ASCSU
MDFFGDYLCIFNVWPDCGDMIDRLNYHYTAVILMITGLSIAGMLYAKHPVQCWVPAEFIPQWEHYAEIYCFTNGFYHVAERCDPETTESDEICLEDKSIYVGYYQWLPLIALLQAFMFAVPLYLWRINAGKSGINVKGVLNSAALVKKKFDRGSRTAQVHTAADHLQEALDMQRELKSGTYDFLHFGKRSGIYLIGLYLFTKLLYVVNVVMQFVILNAFLGPQYTFWGAGILADIWNGKEWNESGHFPRVTMCDFNVRVLGNIHRWTVQCVLMINMFNEKIYIFLWWWFVLVGVLSVLSLLYYLIALTIATCQREFVSRYLRCMGAISEQWNVRDERHLNDFIKKFLRPDGVFLLRLIQINGGDLLVGEIVTALFNRYRARVEDKLSTLAVTESPDSSSSLHRRQ